MVGGPWCWETAPFPSFSSEMGYRSSDCGLVKKEIVKKERKKKLAPSSILREAKIAYYARNMFEAGRFFFLFRKGNVTSRHEPATLISWSLPRQRDVTPYRSPGCADVLRGARADVMDFSYMTLMDTSAVKHNMLKKMLKTLNDENTLRI